MTAKLWCDWSKVMVRTLPKCRSAMASRSLPIMHPEKLMPLCIMQGRNVKAAYSIDGQFETPRKILIMVKAGAPVDAVIDLPPG